MWKRVENGIHFNKMRLEPKLRNSTLLKSNLKVFLVLHILVLLHSKTNLGEKWNFPGPGM